jgi:hypothetical protein
MSRPKTNRFHYDYMAQLMIWRALFRFGRKSHTPRRGYKTPAVVLEFKPKGYDQQRRGERNADRIAEKAALADSREAWIRTTNQKIAAQERARRAHARAAARSAT